MGNYRDETEALAHENHSLRQENEELRARLAGNAPTPQPAQPTKALLIALGVALVSLGATGLILARSAPPPPVAVAAPSPELLRAHIELAPDGTLTLEGLPVTRSELMVQMRTLTAARPGLRVRVSADRSMPYQRVVELTEALRTAGVQNIALNAQR